MPDPNPHTEVIGYGKHAGKRFVEIPRGYLTWMVNEGAPMADVAQVELDRRGTPMPEVDVTPHAVDRASLRCRRTWHEQSKDGEGIYSWLARITVEALETVEPDDRGRYHHAGVRLVIEEGRCYPTLVTVLPGKEGGR